MVMWRVMISLFRRENHIDKIKYIIQMSKEKSKNLSVRMKVNYKNIVLWWFNTLWARTLYIYEVSKSLYRTSYRYIWFIYF